VGISSAQQPGFRESKLLRRDAAYFRSAIFFVSTKLPAESL
jgi:hypothetical protein